MTTCTNQMDKLNTTMDGPGSIISSLAKDLEKTSQTVTFSTGWLVQCIETQTTQTNTV